MATMHLEPTSATASEACILQHEERLQKLEEDRPVHEALGCYQDVSRCLYKCIPDLVDHLQHAHHHVASYLNLFQKLNDKARCEQAWQVTELYRNKDWKMMASFVWQALRIWGGRDTAYYWMTGAPFPELGGSFSPFVSPSPLSFQ